MRARALALAVVLCGPARAETGDAEARAHAHFEIGRGFYSLGDYSGAIREFVAGYELTRKPGFLVNLAQSHRKLGELSRARALYRKYLAEAPPDDADRPAVETALAQLEAELAAIPPRPLPIEPAPAPAPAPAIASPPFPAAAPLSASPEASTPLHRKWWFWTLVGVAAAGTAVGLGVGLSASGGNGPPPAALGTKAVF